MGTNHIPGTAAAGVVQFCTQCYEKSRHTDDKSPLKGEWSRSLKHFKFWSPTDIPGSWTADAIGLVVKFCTRVKGAWSGSRDPFLGRLLRVDLIKWVSNVRPPVRSSTKSLFDFNDIWYVGRGRWVMHDGMQYDPMQGQGQGHETLKVGNSAIFNGYFLPPFIMEVGKWPRILTLGHNT